MSRLNRAFDSSRKRSERPLSLHEFASPEGVAWQATPEFPLDRHDQADGVQTVGAQLT
nr:hypothetical protein [Roseibium sp. MMSF_3544]